ncbi:MAG: hypothetical protein ACRDRK_17785 [Pseudonocardia sp.]
MLVALLMVGAGLVALVLLVSAVLRRVRRLGGAGAALKVDLRPRMAALAALMNSRRR